METMPFTIDADKHISYALNADWDKGVTDNNRYAERWLFTVLGVTDYIIRWLITIAGISPMPFLTYDIVYFRNYKEFFASGDINKEDSDLKVVSVTRLLSSYARIQEYLPFPKTEAAAGKYDLKAFCKIDGLPAVYGSIKVYADRLLLDIAMELILAPDDVYVTKAHSSLIVNDVDLVALALFESWDTLIEHAPSLDTFMAHLDNALHAQDENEQ